METTTVAFRIKPDLIQKFDELCKDEGIYIRSEGVRKAIIAALKRGTLNSNN